MKAGENYFAKQTHCGLTVAEIKKSLRRHVLNLGLVFSYIITGGKQKSGANLRH